MNKIYTFNNPIETGLRALIILYYSYPRSIDLQQLLYFDYLTVHSNDIENGPESIHPPIPNRSGEILVRRELIEQGLTFYINKKLIEKVFTLTGIEYKVNENANIFLDMLDENYTIKLRERAQWVITNFINYTTKEMNKYINKNLDNWGGEFIYFHQEATYE